MAGKNQTRGIWSIPGWPWELELLALIFVICALLIPPYLQSQAEPEEPVEKESVSLVKQAALEEAGELAGKNSWAEAEVFFWGLLIIGIYIAHLIMAGGSYDFVSTPVTHMVAPLIFALLLYYRLYKIDVMQSTVLTPIIWTAGMLAITALVARIRMARHMLNFRHVDWEINENTSIDASFWSLVPTFRPIFYFPHKYRACKEGILIEGWFYIMPIAFDMIESMQIVENPTTSGSGRFLSTSTRMTVEITLYDDPVPVYISPEDPDTYISYCDKYMQEAGS